VAEVQSLRSWVLDWLGGTPDDDVLRWLYRGLLAATVTVVALDYSNLRNADAERTTALPSTEQPSVQPLPARKFGGGRTAPFGQPDPALRDKMTFELEGDGRLKASGTIMPGTAEEFAAEITKRGSYIKTVVLRSPGGSVRDALAMGRLIRQKQFSTQVESGRYCASSCPLVFAGGVERRASSNAAIGVHEVAALASDNFSAAASMKNAQQISAECQLYLREMGVDLEVWIRAMETPREELYYFQPTELVALKLATIMDDSKSRGDTRQKRIQS
jgi:hypothetical protein